VDPFRRHHGRHCVAHRREEPSGPGVEEEGLVGEEQELVERDPSGRPLRHEGRDADDVVGDGIDVGFHESDGAPIVV
jgi:hypothetical protein